MHLPKEKVFTNPADAFNFTCSKFTELKEQYPSMMLDITRFYSREKDNPNCYEALSITFFEMKGYAVTGAIETITLNHPLKAHEFNSEQFDHWGTSEAPFWPITGTAGNLDWGFGQLAGEYPHHLSKFLFSQKPVDLNRNAG